MQRLLEEPITILNKNDEEEFVVIPKSQYQKPASPLASLFALLVLGLLVLLAIPTACRIIRKLFT